MNFNILIAEDEEAVLDILVSIVDMFISKEYPFLNLNISKATNGQIALDIAKKESQDIILSDIVMPKMDGIEFIKAVRTFDKSVPILVLSALSSQEDVAKVMDSGATNYTSKPLNGKIFTAQLKVFVDFYIRRQNRYNKKALNLFSKKIYKRKTEFFIERENDLLEFWEYIIRDSFDIYKSDTTLQYIYDIESLMIKHGISNTIILEENETNYYLTLSHIDEFDNSIYEKLYEKHFLNSLNYKNDGFYDSFRILKFMPKEIVNVSNTEKEDESKKETDTLLTSLEKELKDSLSQDRSYSAEEKITPEILLSELDPSYEDKIEDFLDSLSFLNTNIYNFEQSQNVSDGYIYIQEIVSYIHNFNTIVESMGLFNVVSKAFSILINFLDNLDKDIILNNEKRVLLSKMLLSIANDLEVWIITLFIDRDADDIHYFDTSFSVNCLTIISTFLDEEENEEDDDIEFF